MFMSYDYETPLKSNLEEERFFSEQAEITPEQMEGTSRDQNFIKPSILKPISTVLVLSGILILGYLGLAQDIRYLHILGISFGILLVLSIIIGIFRQERFTIWDALILDDLFELLFYLIAGLVRLIIEIIASD